jgi:hypothetical protein
MLKLPFHVDSPLAAGLVTLSISVGFAFLLWAYPREMIVGRALRRYFQWHFFKLGPEKARNWGRVVLGALTMAFGACAMFGIAVGSGVIKNGDASRPLTTQEFLEKYSK